MEILVIGDVMIDHYIFGKCDRISPEAPVPVVLFQEEKLLLGGAGNVVANLYALGCKAEILSIGGNDSHYSVLAGRLQELSCETSGFIKLNNRPTTLKTRVLAGNHQLIRVDREDIRPIGAETEAILIHWLRENIKRFKVILVSDYNKGLLTKTLLAYIFSLCQEHGIISVLDPKVRDFERYKGVTYIKPNRKEAEEATGLRITDKETIIMACQKIQEITSCKGVVLTLSEDGIALYTNGILSLIPTKALDVVDVTGAGDTVLASLGYSIADSQSLFDACTFANKAAAIVVSKVGCATASIEEVLRT